MKNILLLSISIFISLLSTAQDNSKSDSTVTTYLHIRGQWFGSDRWSDPIISFILTNVDSLGNRNWKSKEITDIEKDGDDGYLVKANVPLSIIGNSSQMWCTATSIRDRVSGYDTIRTNYGGVKISNIKLILKSSPEGAETYLIPNRIWAKDFGNVSLDETTSQLKKFRVNTSSTNTYAFVDETVFVVIFKMNGKFQEIIHRTKPYSVEKEQTVWINF